MGESVAITKVETQADTIVATILTRIHVSPGCLVAVSSGPVAIVRVPRDPRPVRFVEDTVDEKCIPRQQ
jgi:hypothetical protein